MIEISPLFKSRLKLRVGPHGATAMPSSADILREKVETAKRAQEKISKMMELILRMRDLKIAFMAADSDPARQKVEEKMMQISHEAGLPAVLSMDSLLDRAVRLKHRQEELIVSIEQMARDMRANK